MCVGGAQRGGGEEVPVTNSLIRGGVPTDCPVLESPQVLSVAKGASGCSSSSTHTRLLCVHLSDLHRLKGKRSKVSRRPFPL